MKFHQILIVGLVIMQNAGFGLAAEKSDSTAKKLKASASFSLNSNGIASIPAFSLGKPAAIAALSLSKWWFSYDPNMAYGLDGRPWFIDNWFHIRLIDKPAFQIRTGMNVSSYCSKYPVPEGEVLHVERYFTYELATTFWFGVHTSLLLQYWNDRGQEPESIIGHYGNVVIERTDFPVGRKILLAGALQLFYINYTGENDGLFVAPRFSMGIRKVPLSAFIQVVQVITSNVEPSPGTNWNVGIAYAL